jgi:hypothetical protein
VRRTLFCVLWLCGIWLCALSARAESSAPPRRVAVVVGANDAPPGRKALRYAQRDAEAFARVLHELGGFAEQDVTTLLDPEPSAVLRALDAQLAKLGANAGKHKAETLVVFYYSGHADAAALFPRGRPLLFADLRARLADTPAGVRIGIVDACRGGGWTGTKGLSETEPFAVDLPSALGSEGSVLIASSSGLEDAHESEALAGSFFTHHWVAGLRGAADRNADGQVTLTEAFEYARELTIRDTALHTASPQHPSFSMQLRGRSDFALSTLSAATATLVVDQHQGPLELVHLGSGVVVLEIPKGERSLRLAVAPGRYLLRRRERDRLWARQIALAAGQKLQVDEASLTVGTGVLAAKHSAPRPLTLSTLPAGKQEISSWVGVDYVTSGMRLGGTERQVAIGMLAPRGLTDRWQWILPGLGFAYRGGEQGGVEWIPWGGIPAFGMGYSSIQGFLLVANPGFGLDLRRWLGPRSSLDFGLGTFSRLRWTSNDYPRELWEEGSMQGERPERWTPPDTWRVRLSAGYTHTLGDTVTLHLALSLAATPLYEGDFVSLSAHSDKSNLTLSFGSVQSIGLRPLPLLRIHVRDWVALNLNAGVSHNYATRTTQESYSGGVSFVW